ncbi:hypothetical protein M0R72_15740 [Candidatus Pacearchaeota archaeon]|jgi:hypothetical protein|nr:hypothetical protein [Candidatus Pacearchaeota archaeon]
MTIIEGKKAGFWAPHQEAVSVIGGTKEGMTQVGSTLEYYITDRTHAMWDPAKAALIYDGDTAITPSRIDYAGGYVTLQSVPAGTVTCTIYYFAIEALGGAYSWKADLKSDTKEVTTFPAALNSATAWKEYVATLEGWNCSVSRHFFLAKASVTTAIETADANLTWEWNDPGKAGNAEAIVYTANGAAGVARDANVTTVTYTADTTTAKDVKDMIEADPALSLLWTLTYPVTDWNAGYHTGGANPSIDISGGTDTSFNIQADSETSASLITLTVAGLNSGAAIATAMQAAIRALGGAYTSVTVSYEGAPDTDYYLITSGTTGAVSVITITDATANNVADNLKIGVANGGASTAGNEGTGSGKVGAVTHVHASGGRDSEDIAKLGTKCLCVMYLDNTTGSIGKLEGIGTLTGLSPTCTLESLAESDITFEGTSALRYHTV